MRDSYSQWSKYITNVDFKGSTAVGSKGTYTFAPSPGKSRVAPVTLTAYVAGTTPTDASVTREYHVQYQPAIVN